MVAEIYGSRSKVRFNDLVGLLFCIAVLSYAITCPQFRVETGSTIFRIGQLSKIGVV